MSLVAPVGRNVLLTVLLMAQTSPVLASNVQSWRVSHAYRDPVAD